MLYAPVASSIEKSVLNKILVIASLSLSVYESKSINSFNRDSLVNSLYW